MTGRLHRLALLTVVPTAVDVGLLVLLREEAGWVLVLADATAIAAASVLSYALHRIVTFRSDPYVRWVRMPGAFAAVAVLAGSVDVVVLRGLYAAHGLTSAGPLVLAKLVAVAAAAVVRLLLYRGVLLSAVRRSIHERAVRPTPPGDVRATVVIPALDEAARIAGTVHAVREALADVAADGGLEVVVVDDGSSDDTAAAAISGGADQVVVLPVNRGKGAAVRAGVAAARGRVVAFTDADLSYSPDQLRSVIEEVELGWDVVVGNRRHPGATTDRGPGTLRDLGSRAINLVTMAVLLSHPRDTQCGLKAFRSDAARLLFGLGRIDGFAFDIELLHLVERHELSLAEVPVRLRSAERSTVRAARDGVRLLRDVWRIRRWSATGAYELDVPADRAPGPGWEPETAPLG
ncbi:MAG: glycosyltransferase [Acidimicrobiales bacterium]